MTWLIAFRHRRGGAVRVLSLRDWKQTMNKRLRRMTVTQQMFAVSSVTEPFAVSGPRAFVGAGQLPRRGLRITQGNPFALSDPELGTAWFRNRIIYRPIKR